MGRPLQAWAQALVRPLLRPVRAFAGPPPPLGRALLRMLAVWVPLALANAGLTIWQALRAYEALRRGGLPGWVERLPGADPEVLWELLRTLPAPPAFGRIWPWLLLAVPLVVREKAIGVLSCYTNRPRTFSESDIVLFSTLANQTALAIENARLVTNAAVVREMHHRIKNNLQTVAMLLRMQAWHDATEMRKQAGKIKVDPYVAA